MKITFLRAQFFLTSSNLHRNIKAEDSNWWYIISLLVQLLDFVDIFSIELGNVFPKVPLNLLQDGHGLGPVHQVDGQSVLGSRIINTE